MLGTASGLCNLVKNHVNFEALTSYRDRDINQNRVKISIFTLGKESCINKLHPMFLYQFNHTNDTAKSCSVRSMRKQTHSPVSLSS